MHAQTFKTAGMYSHRDDRSELIVRRAAVDFALWLASVRLFALKGYITLMCVTYVLIGGQGPWALAYTRVVTAVLCCRVCCATNLFRRARNEAGVAVS